MGRRPLRTVLLLVLAITSSFLVSAAVHDTSPAVNAIPAGKWISVQPPFGYSSGPVRKYLSTAEIGVVSEIQEMVDAMQSSLDPQFRPNHVRWYVEPLVRTSPTFGIQRDVLYALDRVIENGFDFVSRWPVSIIVARSQAYITRVLQELGCVPNLSRTNGVVLMGASVCDRHVIISNITGFLFVLRADQVITRSMETRREPRISGVPYRIVMRNLSGLAHEYAHIWRAAALGGRVRSDEPAWFSEGFAEFWSGIAMALAYPSRATYLVHHLLRLRDLFDWSVTCPYPLARYRTGTPLANGCEYFLGAIAVEYLYARYSSLAITQDAFVRAAEYDTFESGFEATYGMTLTEFEKEADGYINTLRRMEAYTRSLRRPR